MPDEHSLALRQADQARTDFAIIKTGIETFYRWLPGLGLASAATPITCYPGARNHTAWNYPLHERLGTTRWRSINNSTGVVHLLPTHSELPLPLPRGFVDEMQRRATVAEVEDLATRFAANDIVRVLTGIFQNRFARVLSSARTSTRIKVTAFEREIVATVRTADLQPAAAATATATV
jgi:hypothetical protein